MEKFIVAVVVEATILYKNCIRWLRCEQCCCHNSCGNCILGDVAELFDFSLPSRGKGCRHANKRNNEIYDKMKQPHGIFLPRELLSLIGIRLQLQCGAVACWMLAASSLFVLESCFVW